MSRKTSQKNQTSPYPNMSGYCVVYVTTPNEEVAKKIVHGLVDILSLLVLILITQTNHFQVKRKLAAGANIIPKITSIYEWEDKITEDSEVLMIIKTKTYKLGQLTTFVKANNPYLVPEVLAVPIIKGSGSCLHWIDKVVDGIDWDDFVMLLDKN